MSRVFFTQKVLRKVIFALNMRNALPNAGFIGTPLIKGEEERTREVFGDDVSLYDFARSIEDGATAPLYYDNRIPEAQLTSQELNRDLEALLGVSYPTAWLMKQKLLPVMAIFRSS